jgi:hypothetical protein
VRESNVRLQRKNSNALTKKYIFRSS